MHIRVRAPFDGGTASRRLLLRTAALLLAFTALTACKTSQDAVNAANQLTTVSGQLATYYTDLQQQVTDTVSLNQMQAQMLGLVFDQSDLDRLNTTRDELAKRATMAEALGTLASAYSALAGSKSDADIGNACSSLAKEFGSIKALPGGAAIPDTIAQAGQLLVEAVRTHKLKQASGQIAQAVDAVNQLFEKEAPVYESINRQRLTLAQSLAVALVQKDMVDVTGSLAPALKPFGLTAKQISGPTPANVQHLAEAEIKSSTDSQVKSFKTSTQALSDSLSAVSKKVKAVAGK